MEKVGRKQKVQASGGLQHPRGRGRRGEESVREV